MERDIPGTIRTRLHDSHEWLRGQSRTIGSLTAGHLVAIVLYTQSVAAQEGLEAAADTFCVERVASLASLAYFGVALALVFKGMFMVISPKEDKDTTRKEERNTRLMGGAFILGGALAGVIPIILAGAGIVDVTSCVAPEHVGS